MPPSPPDFPGYDVIRPLGRGSMGEVYLGKQRSMERLVAIKVLPEAYARDRAFLDRFKREARAAARLNHPNIAALIEMGETGGRPFFVMEYAGEHNLAHFIAAEGPFDDARVAALGLQIAAALEHAARHNIVHRDVKPANIVVNPGGIAKLTDLGLALITPRSRRDASGSASASATEHHGGIGTPYYMAPEQIAGGQVDARADLYALAASLYEAATCRKPYTGDGPAQVMARKLMGEALPAHRARIGVGKNLSAVLARAMRRSPAERYRDYAQFREDLTRVADGRAPRHANVQAVMRGDGRAAPSDRTPATRPLFSAWLGWALGGVMVACALLYGHLEQWGAPRHPLGDAGDLTFWEPWTPAPAVGPLARECWLDAWRRQIAWEAAGFPDDASAREVRQAWMAVAQDVRLARTAYQRHAREMLARLPDIAYPPPGGEMPGEALHSLDYFPAGFPAEPAPAAPPFPVGGEAPPGSAAPGDNP